MKQQSIKENVKQYSLNFLILENIGKFISNGNPTGKVMYYSDFRGEVVQKHLYRTKSKR